VAVTISGVLALSGAASGALLGLVIGVGLSIYVARLDLQKREEGVRTKAEYRLSLFGVPVLLAAVGGVIGGILTH
jgi:ABC-type antimicrobial peptide transport system permease subunit